MKILLTFILITVVANSVFCQQVPKVSMGTIRHFENFKSDYVEARNVDVWLPDNYDSARKYSVLYMHDGQMLFDSTINWNKQEWKADETTGQLLKHHKIRDCIIVGIWNTGKNRHIDYFPQKPFQSLTLHKQDSILKAKRDGTIEIFSGKIQSDRYLRFIVNELKPFIDHSFSTYKDRKNTFIAGSSMGGLISIYAICEYPDVFGGAACLSTHWTGTFSAENNPFPAALFNYLNDNLPLQATHKIYFDYGTATLDSLYEPFQLKVDTIMKKKGYTLKNWMTKKFPGEDHSESSWGKRFKIPLLFLLGSK